MDGSGLMVGWILVVLEWWVRFILWGRDEEEWFNLGLGGSKDLEWSSVLVLEEIGAVWWCE